MSAVKDEEQGEGKGESLRNPAKPNPRNRQQSVRQGDRANIHLNIRQSSNPASRWQGLGTQEREPLRTRKGKAEEPSEGKAQDHPQRRKP